MSTMHAKGKATIDPDRPEALGICARCGMQWNLRMLGWQYDWQGTRLMSQNVLVCPDCMDTPSMQKRTIVIPPDPPVVYNVRPEPFSFDNFSAWTIAAPMGQTALFVGSATLKVRLSKNNE